MKSKPVKTLLGCVIGSALVVACALPKQEPEPPLEPVETVQEAAPDVSPLADENAQLKEQLAGMEYENRQLREELEATELRLIAASAQVQRLKVEVEESRIAADEAIAEVVRAQARVQGDVSQADAASNIAEVEILLSEFADNPSPVFEKIRAQLGLAADQFDEDNYGGAMYLSNQARRNLATARDTVDTLTPVSNEESFGELLEMWVLQDSNLRRGPGLENAVITVLKKNTPVRGYSYSGAWVRVQVDDLLEGWIFQPLLTRTNPAPQESPSG